MFVKGMKMIVMVIVVTKDDDGGDDDDDDDDGRGQWSVVLVLEVIVCEDDEFGVCS